MNRRHFLHTASFLIASAPALRSSIAATHALRDPAPNLIPAPENPELWPEFRRQLAAWRTLQQRQLEYSAILYERPDFAWVRTNFACCFLMLCDETFYDAQTGRYRTDDFLQSATAEFGGFDSVVLWHAYPRIGLDDRNQFDFYRDMPGGLNGLKSVNGQFHRAGVKVFLDYNPWDTGTRREGRSDLELLCGLVAAVDADGIFLDTLDRGAAGFRAQLDAVRPGVALEGEGALPLERVHDHHLSWAQGFNDAVVPGVLRNKWFERRHQQHQIKRWEFDHSSELQAAWMNGSGMMVWENVFGSWMGWNPRDKSILRQMLPIQRRYAAWFCGEHWTPLVPTLAPDLYSSLWENNGVRLWTLVNRAHTPIAGPLLEVELAEGQKIFDLVQGQEAAGHRSASDPAHSVPSKFVVAGSIPARGIGCVVAAAPRELGHDLARFLEQQHSLVKSFSGDTTYPSLSTALKPLNPSRPLQSLPEDMAGIPAASFVLRTEVRERECGFYESSPPGGPRFTDVYNFRIRRFERSVSLQRFAIDLTPVTNAQFQQFLTAAAYRPIHPQNFLKHWTKGTAPGGQEDHPVVYVDLDDARAYATWAGKRLPTEEEWQYAAQGPASLLYPWGNELLPHRCNGGETGGATAVHQFPNGRSPFGLWDLCGNVWEWTESERSDGHTRFCMLKGGSFYTAKGSGWYMDGGPRPNVFSEKFLLMWPGLDRCATIGFRCAASRSDY